MSFSVKSVSQSVALLVCVLLFAPVETFGAEVSSNKFQDQEAYPRDQVERHLRMMFPKLPVDLPLLSNAGSMLNRR